MNYLRKLVRLVNIFLLDLGVFTPPIDNSHGKNGWNYNLY